MDKSRTKSTEHSHKKDFTPHYKPISKESHKKSHKESHKKHKHKHERSHKHKDHKDNKDHKRHRHHSPTRNQKVTKHFHAIQPKWIELPHPEGTEDKPVYKIRILSFNILADCNVQEYLYRNVKPEHMDWKYRQPLITSQILELDPDVACLQEFEPSISEDMLEYLTKAGYQVRRYDIVADLFQFEFKVKTGDKEEGCITFWKQDKFELLYNFGIDMNFEDKLEELSFMDKYNIAQIVALKSKTTDHTLIIGNTHLLYNMKRGEIKLGQIMILMKSINEVMALCDKDGHTTKNVFICGDFNSIPNSLLYNVFTQSNFSFHEVPSAQMSNQFYAKYLNMQDDLNHFVESTKKFTMPPGRSESKYPTFDPKYIGALQKVKAKILETEKKLEYTIAKDAKEVRRSHNIFHRADFGLQNTHFESSYAYVNKEHRTDNPHEKSTNVNQMFDYLQKNCPRYTVDRLTYENGISHISGDFKAIVDYMWCDIKNKLRPYRVLETLSYEQFHQNRSLPNADYPSDHLPLVTDFYEEKEENNDAEL